MLYRTKQYVFENTPHSLLSSSQTIPHYAYYDFDFKAVRNQQLSITISSIFRFSFSKVLCNSLFNSKRGLNFQYPFRANYRSYIRINFSLVLL